MGSKHDQVAYYDTEDKVLLKVALSDVVSYLNKTLTRDEMTSTVGKISIGSRNNSQSATTKKDSSNVLTMDEVYPESGKLDPNLDAKAMVYYGINNPNANPEWAALKSSMGSLYSFLAAPNMQSGEMYKPDKETPDGLYATTKSYEPDDGSNLPLQEQENNYEFMYYSEIHPGGSGPSSAVLTVHLPEVVNFINAAGGKSVLKSVHIRTALDN
ncbi:hypothetical protein [Furfurilactobacillus milii]|uniref:Uncharacterized protein n=1 Tax=Furfurilactobacillus milii TaxID=2888272 RepID=A0A6N9I2R7_9LACO|nr:hypothetical protein [Furfurilactobacillus milii]MYV17250.1 hypothetical protein [Furfurilactobacillus milii]